jgi:hypothetical protein
MTVAVKSCLEVFDDLATSLLQRTVSRDEWIAAQARVIVTDRKSDRHRRHPPRRSL